MTPDDLAAINGPLVRSNVARASIDGLGARSAVEAG
jgi:hypothetical protein